MGKLFTYKIYCVLCSDAKVIGARKHTKRAKDDRKKTKDLAIVDDGNTQNVLSLLKPKEQKNKKRQPIVRFYYLQKNKAKLPSHEIKHRMPDNDIHLN